MAGHSKILSALFAVLMIFLLLFASGCAPAKQEYKTGNGDVWTWKQSGNTEHIMLNEKPFATVQNGIAQVSMPSDGRSFTVTLDSSGAPVSIKAAWGITISDADYTTISTGLSVKTLVGAKTQTGNVGWAIVMLLVIIAGVLLFLYAGRLVDNWKLGGFFSSRETAKSMLLFKALGILLIAVGVIVLLVVIF